MDVKVSELSNKSLGRLQNWCEDELMSGEDVPEWVSLLHFDIAVEWEAREPFVAVVPDEPDEDEDVEAEQIHRAIDIEKRWERPFADDEIPF